LSRQTVVQSHLEVLMQEYLEVEELKVTDVGEIHVRTEESSYTARIRKDRREPHLEVFSFVLVDVDADPGMFEALNGLNCALTHCRIFWRDGAIVVSGELIGAVTEMPSLACLITEIVSTADDDGPQLQAVFGGKTFAMREGEQ
jgi:hypothetical protein